MKRFMTFGLIVAIAYLESNQAYAEEHRLALEVQANNIVKQFASQLKPALKDAIQSGGFEHAIEVCSKKAPAIAKTLSDQTGWAVKRVSLKPRSPSAKPNPFEEKVLTSFDARQKLGEPTNQLVYSVKDDEGFHFMKAIPVEAICLTCHGTKVSPSVLKAISTHYPNDMATGYSLDEVRGAFSLVKPFLKLENPQTN